MKSRFVLCAGLLMLTICGSASAQPLPPPYPGHPAYGPGLPAYEVITIVRSLRLEPLTRPFRNGPTYVLRALDPKGQEVRVVVDARLGRVLGVVPLGPRHVLVPPPPPYGRPAGRLVPDGYGPSSRIAGLGTLDDPIDEPHVPATGAPPHPVTQAGPPPLPRPRPKMADVAASASSNPDATPTNATPAAPHRDDASKNASNGVVAVPPPAAPVELQE